MDCCDCILKYVGGAAISIVAVYASKVVYRLMYPFFIAQTPNLHRLAGAKYAVITGSTDEIGKAYATQLAQKGFNIVLISRTQSKLETIKKEIEDAAGVEVETIAFDFTNADVKDYERIIFEKLRSLEIGILVNNVGTATDYPEILHKTVDVQKNRDINIMNTLPVTILSQEVLKQMVPRKSGIIINIGSLLGSDLMLGWSVYSSTKKYISHLSGILHKEYSPFGITIQSTCPGLITTNLSKVKGSSTFVPTPSTYVHSALNTVGNIQETAGYFPHQLEFEVIKLLPTFVLDYFMRAENIVAKENHFNSIVLNH
uniref:Estradiol 17-beta-dehydrogenase 12 n=1 Tax=Rhabditophanes sp. KR3021 TaxID=114890 RepID=A0AC35UDU6_9BILA